MHARLHAHKRVNVLRFAAGPKRPTDHTNHTALRAAISCHGHGHGHVAWHTCSVGASDGAADGAADGTPVSFAKIAGGKYVSNVGVCNVEQHTRRVLRM